MRKRGGGIVIYFTHSSIYFSFSSPPLPPTLPRKFARHVLSAFMQPTIRWWKVLTGYHSKASAALALTVVGGMVALVPHSYCTMLWYDVQGESP